MIHSQLIVLLFYLVSYNNSLVANVPIKDANAKIKIDFFFFYNYTLIFLKGYKCSPIFQGEL